MNFQILNRLSLSCNFILLFVVVGTLSLNAQNVKSMYGKRFFIAFPTIGGDPSDSTYCNFSIYSLNKSTKGKIITPDTSIHFTTEINWNIYSYNTLHYNGLNPNFFNKYQVVSSEVVEKKGIYIETEDSVMMYMYQNSNSRLYDTTITGVPNESIFTSETATLYPIDILSKNYVVLTKSDENAATQFLILATGDSTEIEITPTKSTENGRPAGIPFTITLQKGETYLVRSPTDDLTGSIIKTVGNNCFPIAVFTGSPLTSIEKNVDVNTHKYNILLEQLPPLELIGNRYIVANTMNLDGLYNKSTIKVLALYPNTRVLINGEQVGNLLSTGQFIEYITDTVIYISSENPILAANFIHGVQFQQPSMSFLFSLDQMAQSVIIPPVITSVFNNYNPGNFFSAIIIAKYDDRDYITKGFSGPQWKRINVNPLYGFYTFQYYRERGLKVSNSSGNGLQGMVYSIHNNHGFSMPITASFYNTIFGAIDSTGIFANNTYCQNGLSSFGAIADLSATQFLWEFGDGGKGEGKTVEHIYEQPGQYALKLIIYRDAFCSYDTVRKNISVRDAPIVKAGSRPTLLLCNGQTATLGTNQLPGVTYRWSPAIGLTDTTVGQPTVTALFDSVKYFVLGYDQFGCESRDSIVVKLYDSPIANAGLDTVSCGGNGVQIGRQTSGGKPLYSFLWTPSDGLSNPNIERPIAAPDTTTTYILRVTDINSCVDYDTVTVQALPSPTIDAGNPTTICEGDSVQVTATGATVYRWVNARNISDTTIGNPSVFPTVTTTYYVAGLFPTGCVAFDSVLVSVTPKPRLPIAFQTTACPNATKTYTVENRNDLTYNWEINGGNLTNGQGTNEATVTWGAGPTGSIKLTTTTTAGSCSFDTTVNITISSDIKPTITENKKNTVVPSLGTVRICPNESVTLDVGVGYTEITWTNGSTSRQTTISTEGWYGVSVKDATGCSGGDSVYVEVALPPVIFAGNDRVLCGSDTAVMRGNVNGSGSYTYQWIPPTAVSDPTALVTNFIAPNTTQLIFQAIDTLNGCVTSDTVLMTILSISNDIITTSKQNNVLCFGEQMTLDAGAFDRYLWSTGETSRTINITQGGSYWVDAKSGSCSSIDTIQIIQNPQIVVIPTPDIAATPGAIVTLDANATGGTLPYQFQWTPEINFVDPSNLQSTRVTATVGSQTYIVTITDANDCVARDTITVFVPSTSTTVTVARREVSASALNVNFPLTLTLDPNTPITPTGFTATLTVPFEQFIPKYVTNGTMTITQTATNYVVNITVPITEPLYHNSVITELVGDILLGQQDTTPILISNAQWQGTTYPVNGVNGTIVLNDVCYSGTRRYLMPTTIGFGIMSINPNPAQHTATFEFGIIEAGQTTFEIIDVFGHVMHSTEFTREPSTPKGGTSENRYTHVVDVSSFSSGTYYGVLRSFSQRESVPLVIVK